MTCVISSGIPAYFPRRRFLPCGPCGPCEPCDPVDSADPVNSVADSTLDLALDLVVDFDFAVDLPALLGPVADGRFSLALGPAANRLPRRLTVLAVLLLSLATLNYIRLLHKSDLRIELGGEIWVGYTLMRMEMAQRERRLRILVLLDMVDT